MSMKKTLDLKTMSKHSWIKDYYDAIRKGEIIVGSLVKLQLEKLIDEMEDKDIVFDTRDSDKRIKFIESECRHVQAPFPESRSS